MDIAASGPRVGDELEDLVPPSEYFVEIHMNFPVLCILEEGVDAPCSFVREHYRIAKLFVHLFCKTFV